MLSFLKTQPARVFGVVVAIITLLSAYGVDLPSEAWQGVVIAILALFGGEVVQRTESAKTEAALYTYPPELLEDEDYIGEHTAG